MSLFIRLTEQHGKKMRIDFSSIRALAPREKSTILFARNGNGPWIVKETTEEIFAILNRRRPDRNSHKYAKKVST